MTLKICKHIKIAYTDYYWLIKHKLDIYPIQEQSKRVALFI